MGPLDRYLADLARLGGVVSAAEALVADASGVLWRGASGYRVGGEPLAPGSGARFDAASLTKPWTATLALSLDARGALALSTPLGALVPEASPPLAERTLEDLLRHRAGRAAWTPLEARLGRRLRDRVALIGFLTSEDAALPAGQEPPVYSDLGYLLWGLLAELRLGRPFAGLLDEAVCAPLGVEPLGALAGDPPRPVECRLDNGREVELAAEQGIRLGRRRSFLLGRVQDGNARALAAAGALPAHAGLFVTADEMLALGREWLGAGRLLGEEPRRRALAGDRDWALGWARASAEGSSGPELAASGAAFGHAGFTGGSLWLDPAAKRIYLLLAHRLSSAIDFNPFRREFHRLALETFPA